MKRSLLALLIGLCLPCCAQTPADNSPHLAPNMVMVCNEPCTVTASTNPTAIFQFGKGTAWTALLPAVFPMVADDGGGTMLGDFDPAIGVVKELDAQESTTAYTVTFTDATGSHTKTIPATVCSDAPVPNANPTLPATPDVCPQLPNEVLLSTGGTITDMAVAAPVYMQYCAPSPTGNVCSRAFIWIKLPVAINGANPMLGGSPGANAALYVQTSLRPAVVYLNSPDGVLQPAIVIPATAN